MSAGRIQKLNALLKRVEARRAQPRLAAVPAKAASPARAAPAPAPDSEPELFADTLPPAAPTIAPAATLPAAAAAAPSPRPEPVAEPARRAPTISPLEDAMAHFGGAREDSGPLQVEALASPIHTTSRPSMPDPRVNQDLVLTHRPEAGPAPQGPIVELVQPKASALREPTLQFDTGVKANPLTQRDLKPAGLESPPEALLTGPTHKLEPLPLAAHAAPARVISSARSEAVKTFGELLELSLALRPPSQR
jgi:hypothetical protein